MFGAVRGLCRAFRGLFRGVGVFGAVTGLESFKGDVWGCEGVWGC